MQIHCEQTTILTTFSVMQEKNTNTQTTKYRKLLSPTFHLNLHRTFPSLLLSTVRSPSPHPDASSSSFQVQNQTQVPKITSLQHRHTQRMKEGSEVEVSAGGSAGKRAGSGSGGGGGGVRSETEKEKTKMRERQRRAITTNIFHGLRKHGGYRLSPRADINEVLRELAKEAGWVVLPDGTTFRSAAASMLNRCSVCGSVRSSTPTPTSSVVVSDGGGGGGGERSTTASPCRVPVSVRDYAVVINNDAIQPATTTATATPFYVSGGGGGGSASSCSFSRNLTGSGNIDGDVPLALYVYGGQEVRRCINDSAAIGVCGGDEDGMYEQLQEARASNQSALERCPRRRL